jgi:hypothetical protein
MLYVVYRIKRKEMEITGFIWLIVGLCEVLEVCLKSQHTALSTRHSALLNFNVLNSFSKFFTKHQALCTMYLLLSYAQNKGTIPIHEVSNLSHFGKPSVPEVRNLARKNINEINRGWLRTCTAGQASVPEVKLLDQL